MHFEILGEISDVETFASGSGIREIGRLRRIYGRGRWRKRKGIARVRLIDGTVHVAEYTGMKPRGSGVRNSRSSNWCECGANGKVSGKTVGRVRQQ